MIRKGDVVKYSRGSGFKEVVLKDILNFVADKVEVVINSNKGDKNALDSSIDSEADKIIKTLISGDVSELKQFLPVYGNKIKPLYLFLDEEILLYAKLRKLKFEKNNKKKDRIKSFEDELEKKHPEMKRAVVNSLLELYA